MLIFLKSYKDGDLYHVLCLYILISFVCWIKRGKNKGGLNKCRRPTSLLYTSELVGGPPVGGPAA